MFLITCEPVFLAVPVHQLQSQMTPYQTTNPMVPLSDYNNFTKLEPHPAVADASINFDPNDNGLSSTVLPGYELAQNRLRALTFLLVTVPKEW